MDAHWEVLPCMASRGRQARRAAPAVLPV